MPNRNKDKRTTNKFAFAIKKQKKHGSFIFDSNPKKNFQGDNQQGFCLILKGIYCGIYPPSSYVINYYNNNSLNKRIGFCPIVGITQGNKEQEDMVISKRLSNHFGSYNLNLSSPPSLCCSYSLVFSNDSTDKTMITYNIVCPKINIVFFSQNLEYGNQWGLDYVMLCNIIISLFYYYSFFFYIILFKLCYVKDVCYVISVCYVNLR